MKEKGDVFTPSEAAEVLPNLLTLAGQGSPKMIMNGQDDKDIILISRADLKALLRQGGAPTVQAKVLQLFYKLVRK